MFFQWLYKRAHPSPALAKEEDPTDLNTVVFNLMARCERRKDIKKGETRAGSIWTGAEGELVPRLSRSSTRT